MQPLACMVAETDIRLEEKGAGRKTAGGVVKFFGIFILTTRILFLNRPHLWSKQRFYRFLLQPNIGNAMSRNRLELIRSSLCFSGSGVTEEQGYVRWDFVTDFVKVVNDHRRSYVTPSDALCVDEGMSRWYGFGAHWIAVGLPHYITLDKKPENYLEMKTVCCGRSGIMLIIELNVGSNSSEQDFDAHHAFETALLLRLLQPWFGSERVVCADYFFASVKTAKSILKKKLHFFGFIKNATRKYPMKNLSQYTLSNRGHYFSLFSKENVINTNLMAILWVEKERRYFSSTCGSAHAGTPTVTER